MITSSFNSSERFVYCVSDVFSVWLMRRFFAEQKKHYNACVKIENPKLFIEAITRSIQNRGKFHSVGKCVYQRRSQDFSDKVSDPVFIKEQKYDYQMEVRAAWVPNNDTEQPGFVLDVDGIGDVCKIIYVDEGWHEGPPQCENQTFAEDRILLDFTRYKNCTFDKCKFRYAGFGGCHMENLTFSNVAGMELTDAAYRTVDCLKNLYHTGNRTWENMIMYYVNQIIKKTAWWPIRGLSWIFKRLKKQKLFFRRQRRQR